LVLLVVAGLLVTTNCNNNTGFNATGSGVCYNGQNEPVENCHGWSNLDDMLHGLSAVDAATVATLGCDTADACKEISGTVPESINKLINLRYFNMKHEVAISGELPAELFALKKLMWINLPTLGFITGPMPSLENVGDELGWINLEGNSLCGQWPIDAPESDNRYNHATGKRFSGKPELTPAGIYPNPSQRNCSSSPPTFPNPTAPTHQPTHTVPPSIPEGAQVCREIEDGEEQIHIKPPWRFTNGLVKGAVVVSSISLALCFCGIAFVLWFRKRPIIKYAQPKYLITACLGLTTLNISAIMAPLQLMYPSSPFCAAVEWVGLLSYVLLIIPLAVKNYKVWKVHKGSMQLRRVKIDEKYLLTAMVTPLLLMLVLMVADNLMDMAYPDPCLDFQCVHDSNVFKIAAMAVIILNILLMAIVACYARNVPSVGSESHGIMYTLIFLSFLYIVVMMLDFTRTLISTNLQVFLTNFCVLWMTCVYLVFIVFRKVVWLEKTQHELANMFLNVSSTGIKKTHDTAYSEPQEYQKHHTTSRASISDTA